MTTQQILTLAYGRALAATTLFDAGLKSEGLAECSATKILLEKAGFVAPIESLDRAAEARLESTDEAAAHAEQVARMILEELGF